MSQWEKPRELVDADEPMFVEEIICIDGPVKESTRSDIIEPEEAFLDENAGPENPSRRMRTEERKNNKSHEGKYFETCEEFMKKESNYNVQIVTNLINISTPLTATSRKFMKETSH